jgi:hypothetical protein
MTSQVRADLAKVSDLLRTATLQCTHLNDALRMMHLYSRLHWDNISGRFSDDELEQAVFETWAKTLGKPVRQPGRDVDCLHVATQLYNQGGHSRLLRQLMKGLSEFGSQGLVLTGPRRRSGLKELPVEPLYLTGEPAARLHLLLGICQGAQTVLLHTHPDDSVAAFASRVLRESGKRVLFVNHADHVFSLGPGAADTVLEICMTGWRTTAQRRAAARQSFMGIPVASSETAEPIWEQNRSGPIVSMGGPGKFKPDGAFSFPDFMARILPRIENDFVLIGPSSKDPWWAKVTARFPGRIRLMGTQDPWKVAEIMRSAGCYVDSFPLDGGTAYPQTALMGVPCFGPNANSAPGVSPTDQLRFETLAELEEALVSYLQGGAYPFDLEAVRQSITEDFSVEAIASRVVAAAQGETVQPLDYLQTAGKRGPDYNAERWERDGILHLPKRQWRGLSPGARIRMIRLIRAAGLPSEIYKTMLLRTLTNWV